MVGAFATVATVSARDVGKYRRELAVNAKGVNTNETGTARGGLTPR